MSPWWYPIRSRVGSINHLLVLLLCAAASTHYTATYRCPDSNGKFSNAENQHESTYSHLCVVVVVVAYITLANVVNLEAVEQDDYSTQYSRCDGETHKDTIQTIAVLSPFSAAARNAQSSCDAHPNADPNAKEDITGKRFRRSIADSKTYQ